MLVSDQRCVGRYYPDPPRHVSLTPSLLLTPRDCFPITNKKPMLWCQIRRVSSNYTHPCILVLLDSSASPGATLSLELVQLLFVTFFCVLILSLCESFRLEVEIDEQEVRRLSFGASECEKWVV